VSYRNVKSPLVTKNGVPYDLQYNLTTGDVQIIQQNAPTNTKPIYQDGKWNASATELGFSEIEKNQLHVQTIIAVQTAYKNIGGVNSGSILAQWASENFTTGIPEQSSIQPQNAVSGRVGAIGGGGLLTGAGTQVAAAPGTGSGTGTGGGGTPISGAPTTTTSGGGTNRGVGGGGGVGDLFGFLEDPKSAYKNFAVNGDKFGMKNEKELFSKEMKYPVDLMTSQQDHFAISQFRYRPSKSEAIFGGTQEAVTTLTNGIQAVSNLSQIIGTVFLPMPNSVADSNNVNWGEDSMGNIAAAISANTMGNLKGTAASAAAGAGLGLLTGAGMQQGAGYGVLVKNLYDLAQKGAVSQELSMLIGSEGVSKLLKLQGMGVESESILARGAGVVPNSNLELLFNSPVLRQFTFNYRLSPRSVEEAERIRRIIRFFKQGMAVKKMSGKSGEASFFLGTPNVFKLEYRTGGSRPIDGVNKFKSCALVSFSCNYTPDGLWAAYEKGQPISTVMQMSFSELEPIYDTDYQEGNIFGGRNDLSSVSANSVGY
jgi:hypothetical protein